MVNTNANHAVVMHLTSPKALILVHAKERTETSNPKNLIVCARLDSKQLMVTHSIILVVIANQECMAYALVVKFTMIEDSA